jgi:nucleotide-binding universal stress UspA family protein
MQEILVAVDGSEASKRALLFALKIAKSMSLKVSVITVIQSRLQGYRAGYFSFVDRHILQELREFGKKVLEEAEEVGKKEGVTLSTTLLETENEVYEEIVDFLSKSKDVWLLVLGSFGHSLRDRIILGSTTQRVLFEIGRRNLSVPVVVVP